MRITSGITVDLSSMAWFPRWARRGGSGDRRRTPPVLPFVLTLVFSRARLRDPVGVLLVPADGLAQPLLERRPRPPAQRSLDLGAVDGIAAVVAGPVLDVTNEAARLAQEVEQQVRQL